MSLSGGRRVLEIRFAMTSRVDSVVVMLSDGSGVLTVSRGRRGVRAGGSGSVVRAKEISLSHFVSRRILPSSVSDGASSNHSSTECSERRFSPRPLAISLVLRRRNWRNFRAILFDDGRGEAVLRIDGRREMSEILLESSRMQSRRMFVNFSSDDPGSSDSDRSSTNDRCCYTSIRMLLVRMKDGALLDESVVRGNGKRLGFEVLAVDRRELGRIGSVDRRWRGLLECLKLLGELGRLRLQDSRQIWPTEK